MQEDVSLPDWLAAAGLDREKAAVVAERMSVAGVDKSEVIGLSERDYANLGIDAASREALQAHATAQLLPGSAESLGAMIANLREANAAADAAAGKQSAAHLRPQDSLELLGLSDAVLKQPLPSDQPPMFSFGSAEQATLHTGITPPTLSWPPPPLLSSVALSSAGNSAEPLNVPSTTSATSATADTRTNAVAALASLGGAAAVVCDRHAGQQHRRRRRRRSATVARRAALWRHWQRAAAQDGARRELVCRRRGRHVVVVVGGSRSGSVRVDEREFVVDVGERRAEQQEAQADAPAEQGGAADRRAARADSERTQLAHLPHFRVPTAHHAPAHVHGRRTRRDSQGLCERGAPERARGRRRLRPADAQAAPQARPTAARQRGL
eukprot:TRINITY_DN4007_c0_g1_i1.p1 TRINITY_DN4007_c0_g1~~TRINITY_DN4007_c0_g1_i1.p1  ORF type:complete len:442 (-),score=177.83 TRINITY_DN4007_c0_g1_i1:328-1473(-)